MIGMNLKIDLVSNDGIIANLNKGHSGWISFNIWNPMNPPKISEYNHSKAGGFWRLRMDQSEDY